MCSSPDKADVVGASPNGESLHQRCISRAVILHSKDVWSTLGSLRSLALEGPTACAHDAPGQTLRGQRSHLRRGCHFSSTTPLMKWLQSPKPSRACYDPVHKIDRRAFATEWGRSPLIRRIRPSHLGAMVCWRKFYARR